MPVYEYVCPKCDIKFELLRPLSRADESALCKHCNSESHRVLSLFACISRSNGGEFTPAPGASSCGGCSSTNCSTCG